ncbi:MAG: glycerate kinase, partial [Clostridia bacterium]|nr:glycerate kinase [Clostridia bacterium]
MKKLRIAAALDSFKGSLSSYEAGDAVRRGILRRCPDADVRVFSVGDGGEGTADALMHSLRAQPCTITVSDTHGFPVDAVYGFCCESRMAVFDMASACGIRHAEQHGFDILRSTTYGVGQMIAAAAELGFEEIVVGLGGSGTSDGGIGALSALGARFFDQDGNQLALCTTASLASVASCDLTPALARLDGIRLTLLSDTSVALTGSAGAVMLYSRQKGALPELLPVLDAAMASYASVCDRAVGKSVSSLPGAGAAGGLGYGLSLIGGRLTPGAAYV